MTPNPMPHTPPHTPPYTPMGPTPSVPIMYHLSAARLLRGDVVLYISTNGVPLHTSPDDTEALWQDVMQCFAQEHFPEVAKVLQTLPYTRNSLGAFEIRGPRPQRQKVFRLLIHPLEPRPRTILSVSVKFFRRLDRSRFSTHHWVGRIWDADHTTIPPMLECVESKSVPT